MMDASVVVEYLVALTFTERATAVFRAVVERELELWAPDLMYPESVSALRRMVRVGAIPPRSGESAVRRLIALPIGIASTRDLMIPAWHLRNTVIPYDACYVALTDALDAPVITADQALVEALRARGGRTLFLGNLR